MNQLELKKVIRPVILIVALMIAVYTIVHLWNYYNAAPWTRDGRVRGDVIQVSSDVAGLVTEVLVQDNQTVKKGQVLFKIDVSRRALDVEQAKSDLAKAKAAYAQAQAGLAQAKANLIKSSTNIKLAEKNANRYSNLRMVQFLSKNKIRSLQLAINHTRNMSNSKLLFNKLKPLLNSNRHWLKQQQVIYI